MHKQKILVTGGTGYIGAHTVVELYESGYEAVIVDNFSNSSPDVLLGIEQITGKPPIFFEADCSDYHSFANVFKTFPDIRAAIHFAAFKAVGESVEKPVEYYKNNINSLINLIDLMRGREDSSIVFSSSCTVYGQPDHLPVSENAPLQPATSPYGNTKQICEEILRDCALSLKGKLKVVSLRYFNPIGAHPSSLIGELPRGVPQNLLPFITQTAAGVRKELSVFGDDYNTPDGSCIRDYIYVCDLAKAHILALDRLISGRSEMEGDMEYYNLGTGQGISVLQMVSLFEKATGIKIPYKIAERRAGDIEKVWADPSKANNMLGWKAVTPIDDVLRSAWKWEKKLRGI
ncbi:MAG TPA: UDP-glucose 4-epimerase GalE [Rikenellaceae bacterium]|nr:UDP-glucose 4-epimerase GalE [Bacteroidales bacterium]HBZ35545.1 UDP-glucose 4-epimerase GalE [Rikenellaceae bacterium]